MHPTRLRAGAVSGLIATIPMTLTMFVLHRRLPIREQHRLPPEQITADLVQRSGARRWFTRSNDGLVAWVMHFVFGAGTGALYSGLSPRLPLAGWLKGLAYGVLVWVGAYFGWLPTLRIHGHGAEQSPRRNGLMLIAHLVWGSTLGALMARHDAAA